MIRTLLFILLTFYSACASFAWADMPSHQAEIVRATLMTQENSLAAGRPFRAAVLLEPKRGWHTYWENPGDAGMPTTLKWTLPEGFDVSPIDWPPPQRLSEGPLVTYAYEGDVLLPVTITPSSTLTQGEYPLKVRADWLVCKDICIPESAELELTLPVIASGETRPSEHAPRFERHQRSKPILLAENAGYFINGKELHLSIPLSRETRVESAFFYPREPNVIDYPAPQPFHFENGTLAITLARINSTPPETLTGILEIHAGTATPHYYDITAQAAASTASPSSTGGEAVMGLPLVLLFAVLGGLILNLMPCVLPVLSLKALAIAKKSGYEHGLVVRHGLAYTFGILISFAAIASLLLALRQGGEAVGWGYQMQSPAFVGFLIYLLFLVGLNLSGFFHLPVLLGSAGRDITSDHSTKGSFFTGILATAVATPCTAPFMASAIGVALTLPPWQALLVFEALGFGLALPFLLISLFPVLRRFLPKPGAWMETFRQLLAFPMYASVVWLMWVLTLQTGANGMAIILLGMLSLVIVIWMKSLFAYGSGLYRTVALFVSAAILLLSLPMLNRMEYAGATSDASAQAHGIKTVAYSRETLDALRVEGAPVFVDATAAWCITCQVNARVAIHTPRVAKTFNAQGVTLMIADWTRRNDDITAFLSEFGHKGVPLYVFYPPQGGAPRVLPQLLTEDIVIEAITNH